MLCPGPLAAVGVPVAQGEAHLRLPLWFRYGGIFEIQFLGATQAGWTPALPLAG